MAAVHGYYLVLFDAKDGCNGKLFPYGVFGMYTIFCADDLRLPSQFGEAGYNCDPPQCKD